MKNRVMILDDEYIILDGLCSFPWQDYGFEIAATARNGIEGIEKLNNQTVDLILCDVKMPGMDGIEFSRLAKKMQPDAVIVFLTGYDNFEYAQQAISIGVEEYLLKPVVYDDLKNTIDRLSHVITDRKIKRKYINNLQKYFELSVPKLREKFVSDVLHGRIRDSEEMEQQKRLFQIEINRYVVCVCRKYKKLFDSGEQNVWMEEVAYIKIFEEIFSNYGISVLSDYDISMHEYDFILSFPEGISDDECAERVQKGCSQIQQEVNTYMKTSINFGLSNISRDLNNANMEYRNASMAYCQCIYLGENVILKYSDLGPSVAEQFFVTYGEKSHLMMTLFYSSMEETGKELRAIFAKAPEDITTVKFAAIDLYISCIKFPYNCAVDSSIKSRQMNSAGFEAGLKALDKCETKEDIVDSLLMSLKLMLQQDSENADNRNAKIVGDIENYINDHYADDLSMDLLSDKFFLSKTYISRLFKKYDGRSFLEYLTDERFKHVEELIAGDRYKQSEIAELVGYHDFGYYIKVFKKRYGMTPNEYRRRIKTGMR